MNLGLAIFLSAFFIGIIWLYYITRDRWNWKKIFKWFGIIVLSVGIILVGILIYQKNIQEKLPIEKNEVEKDDLDRKIESLKDFKPEILTKFGDFYLGDTQINIKFHFGKPQKVYQKPEVWVYNQWLSNYILYFINKKVIFITDTWYSDPYFNKTEEIIMKWGKPKIKINFADDYKKLFLYPQYNLFFIFYRNAVIREGIYLPEYEKEVTGLILSQQYF